METESTRTLRRPIGRAPRYAIRARICRGRSRRSPGAPRNARHPWRRRSRANPQAIMGKGESADARPRRPRPPRHAGGAAALRAAQQGRRADRRRARAPVPARPHLRARSEAAAEAARGVAGARIRHPARQGRGRGVARHARRDRVRRTRRERGRLRARASQRVAGAVDFPPGRRNGRRGAADRRAPCSDDQPSSSPTRASPSCGRTAARTSPSTSSRCRCCARWAC